MFQDGSGRSVEPRSWRRTATPSHGTRQDQHDKASKPSRTPRVNAEESVSLPHSPLTDRRRMHHPQEDDAAPDRCFTLAKSHLSGLERLESRTVVPRQTATGAIGATRFTLNDFRYFSLSFQSSFHLSVTVLVRYRSSPNI